MDVVSSSGLRVGSILWQPAPSAWVLTVVCKATYLLQPGQSPLADTQDDTFEADSFWNDDEQRSLDAASDLAPFKPRADVILVGHAYAPGRRPATSILTRLVVGEIDKAIEVFGDRFFTLEGQLHEAPPILRVPLRWERAAGGPDTSNPVGMRLDARPNARGLIPVPNLQAPGVHVTSPHDFLMPIGFGPVAPAWPGRASKLNRYAAGWDHRRYSDRPLPEDIDPSYFNAAPPDQQIGEIRPDERIVLENLHPEHERLTTRLCGALPRAIVSYGLGGATQEIALRCDTLWIDTDRGCCSLTWRGQLSLDRPDRPGQVVVTLDALGRGAPALPPLGGYEIQSEDTIDPFEPELAPRTTPFRAVGSAPPPPPPLAPSADFREEPASVEETVSLTGAIDLPRQALPFERKGAMPPPVAPMPVAPAPLAFTPVASMPVASTPVASTPVASETLAAPLEPATLPPPPPMVGPLATPEMAASQSPLPPPPAVPVAEPLATPAADEAGPPTLPLPQFPIERCAAIAAAIARTKEDTARILADNDVTAAVWAGLAEHWAEAIKQEMERGKTGLRRAYDAAYVAELERERGPIQTHEYARLVVAAERGKTEDALAELSLPRGAMMPLQRVWVSKIAEDAAFCRSVSAAVDAAREG